MKIIVSDTSCLIDLAKGALLGPLFQLPYTIVIPDLLFRDEVLHLHGFDKKDLLDYGLEVRGLDPEGLAEAQTYYQNDPALSLPDAFALVLTGRTENALLLSGDRTLRRVATEVAGVEVGSVPGGGVTNREV